MSQLNVDSIKDRTGTDQPDIVGVAKAFVNFNGTGTVTIRNGFNVSSITDNGTGNYTVNFTTAMPNADYSAILGGSRQASAVSDSFRSSTQSYSTSSLKIRTSSTTANTAADHLIVTAAVFI